MIIIGADISMNSSGLTRFVLDEDLNILEKDYLGFSTTKKLESDKIIHYKKDQFKDELEKDIFFKNHIINFVSGAEYVGIEGYSYGSKGNTFEIGQFTGNIKYHLYEMGCKIRIHDPNSIKVFATDSGSANKFVMYNSFLNHENKIDISNLPKVDEKHAKKGISPTSDLVDSFFICSLLQMELKLRKGLIELKNLNEKVIKTFNRVTNSYPVNILAQDFIYKGNN